mgnify:FL=1
MDDLIIQYIKNEFATAGHAKNIGNDGMARVCARRACGIAITFFLQYFPEKNWGSDAMNQLRNLQSDISFSEQARNASQRLITKVNERFSVPFSNNPIDDAKIIIEEIENKLRFTKV